jgi:Flp pilus assembly protein TadG
MLKRFTKDESGQVLVMTLVSLTALMGFMAFAVDMGMLFRAKRNVQTAADAGAVAAALEYWYNGSTNVPTVARQAAANNGISHTSTQVTVNLNPNITSTYHSNPGYVQVIVSQPNPTFFMGTFGKMFHNNKFSSVNVAASAIAGIAPNPACIIALDQTSASALWIKGNASIQTTQCGIQVDSNSNKAVCVQGTATINGPYLRIRGSQSSSGQCGKNPGTTVYNDAGDESDPFAGITGPNPKSDGSCKPGNTYSGASLTALSQLSTVVPAKWPSTDTQAPDAVTCFSANVSISNVTLPAGLYLFENGVNIGNNVVVNGGTLDIYGGSLNNQNGSLTVTAPAGKQYAYNAIAIMQPSYNTTAACQDSSIKNKINTSTCLQVQFGSANEDLVGYIYAPSATVYLQDQGGGITAAGVVSDDMYINSQLDIKNNYNLLNPSTTPLATVALVE